MIFNNHALFLFFIITFYCLPFILITMLYSLVRSRLVIYIKYESTAIAQAWTNTTCSRFIQNHSVLFQVFHSPFNISPQLPLHFSQPQEQVSLWLLHTQCDHRSIQHFICSLLGNPYNTSS